MITDDERREVARRLREIDYDSFSSYGEEYEALYRAIGLYDSKEYSEEEWPGRLADLIEPQPERTCRLVLMDDEAVIAERAKSPDAFFPQDIPTARFCSACGAKYPAWAELPENLKYCNMCGAKVVNDD